MRDGSRLAGPIPVGILTGFLGAGKSTRLARLLKGADAARTAVIVNEFGAVGIDHDLLSVASNRVTLLENGCLCCVARSGLQDALEDLHARRERGELDFDRVVVETSGLADPGVLLFLLSFGGPLAGMFVRANVVALVDASTGAVLLEEFVEAARQVALADRIVLTHTDLAPAPSSLRTLIEALNATAPLADDGRLVFADLFEGARPSGRYFSAEPATTPVHRHAVRSGIVIDEKPTSEAVLELLLEGLQSQLGDRLLRVKGFVRIAGSDRILLVQGTHRRGIERVLWDAVAPADRRTRITVIARDMPQEWPAALYRCIREEVRFSAGKLVPSALPVSPQLF